MYLLAISSYIFLAETKALNVIYTNFCKHVISCFVEVIMAHGALVIVAPVVRQRVALCECVFIVLTDSVTIAAAEMIQSGRCTCRLAD